MGGTNSRQNYEFQIERKVLKERSFMNYKRAYFANVIKSDRWVYVIGGRGDPMLTNFDQFVKSQYTMESFDIDTNRWI